MSRHKPFHRWQGQSAGQSGLGCFIFRGWYRDAGAALGFSVDTVTNALTCMRVGRSAEVGLIHGGSPVAAQRIAPAEGCVPPTPLRGVAVLKEWYRDVAGLQP